jgi:hypothetical protein
MHYILRDRGNIRLEISPEMCGSAKKILITGRGRQKSKRFSCSIEVLVITGIIYLNPLLFGYTF